MSINIAQIENNICELLKTYTHDSFIFDLILAYGLPRASVARLQKGNLNLSKNPNEVIWRKTLYYRNAAEADIDELKEQFVSICAGLKQSERFVIVTNFKTLFSLDTKTGDKLDIEFSELPKHFDFFLPWAGMEKAQHQNENPADVKAAEKMAKLFDAIKKDNLDTSPQFVHGLNVFLARLLFCYFAEDTGIFEKGQFTNAIDSHTQGDGLDLNQYFDKFFTVLDTEKNKRPDLPAFLEAFPYVNGGLFAQKLPSPLFTRRSRQAVIDCGELDWKEINPDIFGSMFQAVIGEDQRGNLGQHYTSVPNIMKVIEPLFLSELYEEFEKATAKKDLQKLADRIANMKIFDPACGSGNFLIIAYKELRRLEMKIFQKMNQPFKITGISLSHFYGIEIDDFAHEIAQLSLWLAQHQMNVEFFSIFGSCDDTLPLKDAGVIVQGNACRLNWEEVCPKREGDEIYILGNPPYLGSFLQNKDQKSDLAYVCKDFKSYKDLDYIANWFLLGARYAEKFNCKYAFVTTNSVCQGEQVVLLWPYIFSKQLEIFFAYESFKWTNNAKKNAGVTCSIIGISNKSGNTKKLISSGHSLIVNNITPYLTSGNVSVISKRMKPLSEISPMSYGSKIVDNGHLIFSPEERKEILEKYPESKCLFRRLMGSAEFIRGVERWCLYVKDEDLALAESIPPIKSRFEKVAAFRLASTESSTREAANHPHKFYYSVHTDTNNTIIVPSTSSERRNYIPMGFLNSETIISNAASAIFNANPWVFSILTSKMHMAWVRAVSGKLEERLRYSSQLCYNTFPFPSITEKQKMELTQTTLRIIDEREKFCYKTLAFLYDPDTMPEGLRNAHHANDIVVEKCYREQPFESDEERLEYLFKLYEKMIEEEKNKGTFFEKKRGKYYL